MIYGPPRFDLLLRAIPYEFKDGSYVKSDQYKRYRAAVDEIHLLAVRLQRERNQ